MSISDAETPRTQSVHRRFHGPQEKECTSRIRNRGISLFSYEVHYEVHYAERLQHNARYEVVNARYVGVMKGLLHNVRAL